MPDPKRLIEEKWQEYLRALGPQCCEHHEKEKRDVFFAGAAAMINLLTFEIGAVIPDPLERYDNLRRELRAHTDDLTMRMEPASGRIH